jgi:hypothetical protein
MSKLVKNVDLHDGIVEAGPEAAGLVADVEVSPAVHQQPVVTASDNNF